MRRANQANGRQLFRAGWPSSAPCMRGCSFFIFQFVAFVYAAEVETESSDPEEERECEEEGGGSGGEDKVEMGKEEERNEEGEAEEVSSCDLTPQEFSKRRVWER